MAFLLAITNLSGVASTVALDDVSIVPYYAYQVPWIQEVLEPDKVELGSVAHQRFYEARVAGLKEEELLRHLNDAIRLRHEALRLFPKDAVEDLAATYNWLGIAYDDAGDTGRAVEHFREAIHRCEKASDLFHAAQVRRNVADIFFAAGRLADALAYAEAALRGFESYGERATEMIERTRVLIAKIRGRWEPVSPEPSPHLKDHREL
jgi:tetratricopeptide (TPR) repeat protein